MNGFLWSAGHLGWGIFAVLVFSGVWLLASDLVWRLRRAPILRLAGLLAGAWTIAVALIVLGFWLVSR